MFTFGLVELLLHFVLWWEVNITGTTGRFVPTVDNTTVYYLMLTIFVVVILTAYLIKELQIRACPAEHRRMRGSSGPHRYQCDRLENCTFALSAFFMGAAGAIMATRWTYIDPRIAFNPVLSFLPVLMAIFGGMGQLYGPIIGAAIFAYLEEFLITRFPYHYMLIFGITHGGRHLVPA